MYETLAALLVLEYALSVCSSKITSEVRLRCIGCLSVSLCTLLLKLIEDMLVACPGTVGLGELLPECVLGTEPVLLLDKILCVASLSVAPEQ